jgi:hypothetical protein
MRHIALLMLLIGAAATAAHADVPVEKWHVWYTSAKTPPRKVEFAEFFVPTGDGTYKFKTGLTESGPGTDPNAGITADVTVTRHGQELDVSWETHDPHAGKSWPAKPTGPVTILPANKFQAHLVGGDNFYGQKE